MALVVNDRVKETTAVVGTGTATLLGAALGFQSFAVIGNGNTTYYCISDQGGANWEVGIGTYTTSGTTLARTTVLASSNAGALVVFTTGVKDVFVTYPSEKGVWYDASGNVLFTGTTTAANLAYTGTLTGSTGILNIGSGQLYKNASGNVGIGTSSPAERLTVNSASSEFAIQWSGPGNEWVLASAANRSYIRNKTASVETLTILNAGNVGIGTSSPSKKLEVAGDILGTTVSASNGFVLNNKTVSTSYTFPAGYNAVSVGAVTINSGVVVTVPSTQRWVVL